MKVLIVDDSDTSRMLLGGILAAEGLEILEAGDGLQALEVLRREEVDAVISDILMPRMDGYRLCDAIRKNKKVRSLPFITYSATYLSDADQKLALQVGVDKFMINPADPKEIVQTLQELISSGEKKRRKIRPRKRQELFPLKEYTAAVVRKLEETNADLISANETLTERVTLASFTAEVSSALTQVENLREMLQRCAETVVRHLEAAFARIWTLNPRGNILELQASAGMYTHIVGGHSRVPVGQFKIGLIAAEKIPHLTNSVIGDPRVHDQEWAKREGMVAFAGYPLLVENRLVGVMAMFARKPLSGAVLQAMASIANDIAAGIQRKLAEERARQHFNRIRALHEIDTAISSTLELREVLDVLLEKIDVFFPFPSATTVRLRNPATEELESLACRNMAEDDWRGQLGRPLSGRAKKVLETKLPMIVRNVQTDPQTINPAIYAKYGLVSYAGLPLVVKDQAMGVLGLYTKQEHAFTDEEVEFLSTLAGQAAIAIHNAQLYEQTKKQSMELVRVNEELKGREEIQRLLKELSQDITTMDVAGLLEKLTQRVRDVLKVDVCDVRTLEEEDWQDLVVSNVQGVRDRSTRSHRGRGTSSWIRKNRKPLSITDITQAAEFTAGQTTRRLGLRGFLGVPLIGRRGEAIGVLRVMTHQPRGFTSEEIELLQQLASGAAIAIENAQLYQDLEKSDKVKTEFLGVMSHELRTPLNVILGYTNLLLDEVLGKVMPKQQDGLRKIARQSKELLSMVESIMEATKIESESVLMEKHEVNLGEFLSDLRQSYNIPFEKDLSLSWDYPSDLPAIMSDSFKLAHILQNLINNALKFTEKGTITISARVMEDTRDVEFRVSDTGIGIAEESLPVIFDMFRQVDSSDTRLYGGAGLGLYIVKKFTELLGGTVEVQSQTGSGSTFTVRIPA